MKLYQSLKRGPHLTDRILPSYWAVHCSSSDWWQQASHLIYLGPDQLKFLILSHENWKLDWECLWNEFVNCRRVAISKIIAVWLATWAVAKESGKKSILEWDLNQGLCYCTQLYCFSNIVHFIVFLLKSIIVVLYIRVSFVPDDFNE